MLKCPDHVQFHFIFYALFLLWICHHLLNLVHLMTQTLQILNVGYVLMKKLLIINSVIHANVLGLWNIYITIVFSNQSNTRKHVAYVNRDIKQKKHTTYNNIRKYIPTINKLITATFIIAYIVIGFKLFRNIFESESQWTYSKI